MKLVRFFSCFASVVLLAGSTSAGIISDYSNFTKSGNMLNSASHNREQNFDVTGLPSDPTVTVTHDSISTGSAGQEIFGTSEFAPFTTVGYRLSVNLKKIDWDGGTTARVGLVTADAVPAGGPGSGDVRASGNYFYWVYRAGSVMAGMYRSDGTEEEASLISIGTVPGSIKGLWMERVIDGSNGPSWDLGYIDGSGNDVFVQNRASINGETITTTGDVVGIYSDMRSNNEERILRKLSYGIPEPTSLALLMGGVGFIALGRRR